MADYLVSATRNLNEAKTGILDFEGVADGGTFRSRKYAYPDASTPVYVVLVVDGAGSTGYSVTGVSSLTLVGVWLDGDYAGTATSGSGSFDQARVVLSYTGDVSGAAVSDSVGVTLS